MKVYYKVHNSRNSVELFSNYFKLYSHAHVHRYETTGANNVFLSIPNGMYGFHVFCYRVSKILNKLPVTNRNKTSIVTVTIK